MSASSRALGALALAAAILVPVHPAAALTVEDTAQDTSASASSAGTVMTPSGKSAEVLLRPRDGSVEVPPVAADSWVVADLDSGAILASQNADLAVRPASTLKLLTALTVSARLAPEQPYRAVKADEQAEGNRVVLYDGLAYSVADLMHAALLPSANDAAEALARANGGIAQTVEQMNAEAARLGATGTSVRNPSGLDADGQLTTARDMALVGRAALANPEIAAYLKLRLADFPGKMEDGKRVIYPIYNHNRTVAYSRFEGYLGGKSGYTSKAGNTLVAGAERDGRRLLVTLFHIGGNTYRAGEALLAWGFANADKLDPIGTLAEPTAPAPTFDRTVVPLPEEGQAPVTRTAVGTAGIPAEDAPTATSGASSWSLLPGLPTVSVPSPLTVLTLLMAALVALRARVYWLAHRRRTGWTGLDQWARQQARGSRRPAPTDARMRPVRRPTRARAGDDALVSAHE